MQELNLDGIGEKISRIRKAKGLTIKDMVEYTGLSAGYLSNLETGKTSPTLENLRMVTNALQTDIIGILTEEKKRKRIIREKELEITYFEEYNMEIKYIDFGYDPQLYEIIKINPGESEEGAFAKHLYSENCFVVEGELTVQIDEEVYKLHKFDSIYIPEKVSHRIWNEGEGPAISYWVYHRK